ncbi:MAG: hypothetical protein ACUVRA_05865, partial [Candidatus Bathyarchaeaceae archaeon]
CSLNFFVRVCDKGVSQSGYTLINNRRCGDIKAKRQKMFETKRGHCWISPVEFAEVLSYWMC